MKNKRKVKPSLNLMVLESLSKAASREKAIKAADIKAAIAKKHGFDYPTQTIIVVLNRFTMCGKVCRITTAPEAARERYAYYLAVDPSISRANEFRHAFHALVGEFFNGDLQAAFAALVPRHGADVEALVS